MTFESLDDAYQAAHKASRSICAGATGDELRRANLLSKAAAAYIVKAEKLLTSHKPPIAANGESIVLPEHRRNGKRTQKLTREARMDIAAKRYLTFIAEQGGAVESTALYDAVKVSDLGGQMRDSKHGHRHRLLEVYERGLIARSGMRGHVISITEKGRTFLEEQS